MLADKTLLSVTLAAAFASGTFVGYAAKGSGRTGPAPYDAAAVYAPQLERLQAQGYDATEMEQAGQAYADYLKSYQYWWNEFLGSVDKNLRDVDAKLEKRLAALEAAHRPSAGPK